MVPENYPLHVTDFRTNMAHHIDFVRVNKGLIWLMSRRRIVAGLVSPADLQTIYDFHSDADGRRRRQMAEARNRWDNVRSQSHSTADW